MKEIFVVFIETGEYSDYTMSIDCAFQDKDTAERYCSKMDNKPYNGSDYNKPRYSYYPTEVRDML